MLDSDEDPRYNIYIYIYSLIHNKFIYNIIILFFIILYFNFYNLIFYKPNLKKIEIKPTS